MRLHYPVKFKIRVFVKILTLEKRNARNVYSLALILIIKEDATF